MCQLGTWVKTEYVYGCIMSTFRDGLKQLLEGKIFPVGRAMSGTIDYPLCGEGKRAKMRIYAYSCAVVSDQGKPDRLDTRKSRDGSYEQTQESWHKVCRSPYQMFTSSRQHLPWIRHSTAKETKWLGHLMSASLHHRTSQGWRNGHMSKGTMVAEAEVTHRPSSLASHLPGLF